MNSLYRHDITFGKSHFRALCFLSKDDKKNILSLETGASLDQPVHSRSRIDIFVGRVWIAKATRFLKSDNNDWSDCAERMLI